MKRLAQHIVAVLIVLGALNWGMVGLFGINVVTTLFGESSFLANAIYTIIGVAGLLFAVIEGNEHAKEKISL